MIDENLKSKLIEFSELKEEYNKKYFAWLRNIIGMAIALLGILVSLKPTESMDCFPHLVFSSVIGLITIGILSGSLLLFVEVKLLEAEIKIKHEWIIRIFDGKIDKYDIEEIPYPWYFTSAKFICYISFSSSLIGLTIYTIISNS